jgi:hypothetical protein
MDDQFHLLGFGEQSAYLYLGSQMKLQLLKVIPYEVDLSELNNQQPKSDSLLTKKDKNIISKKAKDVYKHLTDHFGQMDTTLFLSGHIELSKSFRSAAKNLAIYPENIRSEFNDKVSGKVIDQIRAIQRLESKLAVDQILNEFQSAFEFSKIKQNLFQIAKAAVTGNVQKLVISEEVEIFGKLNPENGLISIHAADMDHEDDDLLDDIAQTVLSFGGEVIIAKQNEMPNNKPILALFNNPTSESDMVSSSQNYVMEKRALL